MLTARRLTAGPAGSAAVLRELDLTLHPGEWVALTGRNGTGKSTLCLALAGLLAPRAGEVALDGLRLGSRDPRRASIGIVFQEPEAQLVAPTLEEELAFPLENLGWERSAIRARLAELVTDFELSSLAGRSPAGLSGGEKSRLGMAAAMAGDPRYLILDEPGVYLDQAARERLRALVRREVDRGRGVLFVTQLEEEWVAAGRRLVLEEGATREAGAALETMAPEPPVAWPLPTDPVLAARGITFSYGETSSRPLIDGADLVLASGEAALLTGASGSGKTTLLLLLCGILSPGGGAIELSGDTPLGVLLQSPEDQLVSPSVLEDVELGARESGVRRQEIAKAALAEVGLGGEEILPRPPGTLSHGQKRRAAWAGLLARDARLWLLDEPTTGLDTEGVLALRNTTRRFVERGGAALIVSQDPRLEGWGMRRYHLSEGRIRLLEGSERVIEKGWHGVCRSISA
jgi:energy-coupling factor transport system ATP-binding protein